MAHQNMKLFTYGTLMFPEVWQRIAMTERPSQPATLRGYAAYRVLDAVYPGIIFTGDDNEVVGRVYRDLDEDTLFELDTYESDFYRRMPVEAFDEQGRPIACEAYVVPESRRAMLSSDPWDAEWFRKHELQKYLHG